ncbi:sulfatase modifying factor 1, partial [Klebsiella pneumoniae]
MAGKKFDLPTEAQWEYAAKSRGQYIQFATKNGEFLPGKNIHIQEWH